MHIVVLFYYKLTRNRKHVSEQVNESTNNGAHEEELEIAGMNLS
jgi:hypothetical protein